MNPLAKTALVLVLVLAMAFLLVRTLGADEGVYYLELAEFARKPTSEPCRLAGFVDEGSVERDSSGLVVRFAMRDEAGSHRLPVVYDVRATGSRIPDTFAEGGQVVVTGQLDGEGFFQASQLLAKCPSKYEAADPALHPGPQS